MKKVLSVLVGAVLLFGSAGLALAYTPLSYQFGYTDSGGANTTTITAPSFPDAGDIVGTDPTTGQLSFLQVGSGLINIGGIGLEVRNVLADKIVAPDGNPLGYYITNEMPFIYASTSTVNSDFASLSSSISSLGTPLNIGAFMGNNGSTSPYIASSTQNGFMSATQAVKLASVPSTIGLAYEGTTTRSNSFPIFKSATVASGVAVFNMTTDGTSGSTSLCPNGIIQDSVNPSVNDATASYQMSWAWSNSNKTLTVTANKLTTSNILTGILGQVAANATVVKVSVWCY